MYEYNEREKLKAKREQAILAISRKYETQSTVVDRARKYMEKHPIENQGSVSVTTSNGYTVVSIQSNASCSVSHYDDHIAVTCGTNRIEVPRRKLMIKQNNVLVYKEDNI
jgi:isoaspartyl peptidase/L-asparaginase-like protein (Ntn-hydrolase superfamily)